MQDGLLQRAKEDLEQEDLEQEVDWKPFGWKPDPRFELSASSFFEKTNKVVTPAANNMTIHGCKPLTCWCPGGTPAEGTDCPSAGFVKCVKCADGFVLNPSTLKCVAKCACLYGHSEDDLQRTV